MDRSIDWRRVAARFNAELDRAKLNDRARRLARLLALVTLMRGRTSVLVEKLEFCALLDVGKTHVGEVLAELVGARIVVVREREAGWEFTVFPSSEDWDPDLGWYYAREARSAWARRVEGLPGQAQGQLPLPPEPDLVAARAQVSVENAASSPAAATRETGSYQNGNGRVTKMVTARAPLEFSSSEFGTKLLTAELSKERELMQRCRELFDEKTMLNWGGCWRNRARANPGKLARVLDELAEQRRERQLENAGGYANDLWKRFR